MTSPTLLSLADRVESLTGPCRETDCLLFELGHRLLTPERRGTIDGEPTGEYFDLNGNMLPERARRYTASLDAAMTLVPEKYTFNIYGQKIGFISRVFPADIMAAHWKEIPEETKIVATPALALTAASLRARSALEASHG